MITKNIEHVRGDTLSFNVNLSEIDTATITIESLYFSVKPKPKIGEEYIFQKSLSDGITQLSPAEGANYTFNIRVAPEDTYQLPAKTYYYDLQIGLGNDIYTIMYGEFKVLSDVTEETSHES